MLVPFYFLIGVWGGPDRVRATTTFVIYTLVGSLLMLAAAVATGILATPAGGRRVVRAHGADERRLSEGTQEWIFLCFALAFLVKMPAFPLHAWMPGAYTAAPTPVVAVLSGVLSKVAAYGFLRIVLPVFPDASVTFQELMLVIAVASILYGSVMAFTQSPRRWSSGTRRSRNSGSSRWASSRCATRAPRERSSRWSTTGSWWCRCSSSSRCWPRGSGGTDDLRRMGGLAVRAPVLAALFLIVALATLAMPGSANFVGEFLILTGVFKAKIVYAIVAGAGIALAAVYMIRLYQRSMHNPLAPGAESREMSVADAVVIVPIVAVILFLAVYPQFVLERSETTVTHPGDPGDPMNGFDAPYIDYAGISPLIALTAGTCVTLRGGPVQGPRARPPCWSRRWRRSPTAAGLSAWQFGEPKSLVEGALRSDDLSLSLSFVFYAAAAVALLLALGERGGRPSVLADYAGLLLASVTGMVVLAGAINLVTLFVGIELLSIPLYVMCAIDLHRRTSLESGLKYLVIGSVGSATLLYGLAFIYGASGSTDFAEIARAIGDAGIAGDPLLLTGIALTAAGLAFKASVAPFHQWTPDVYEGAPTSVTAFMAVATKTAAFAILLRLFDIALLPAKDDWDVALRRSRWRRSRSGTSVRSARCR